jgi:uncharacterized protein YqeY
VQPWPSRKRSGLDATSGLAEALDNAASATDEQRKEAIAKLKAAVKELEIEIRDENDAVELLLGA